MEILKCSENDETYEKVCDFIKSQFETTYGAKITNFSKNYIYIKEKENIVSTIGFRIGEEDSIFSQIYFDNPIEENISSLISKKIHNEEIVEFVNLVSIQNFYSLHIMKYALDYFKDKYIIFTATEKLINISTRYGLKLIQIKHAVKISEDWGTYYSTNPKICLIVPRPQITFKLF